jgi:hypothetical protein
MNTNQLQCKTSSQPLSNAESAETVDSPRRPERQGVLARPYPCLVPDGEYLVFCTRTFRDKKSRGYGEKIYISFQIFDGEHAGKKLRMFFRPSLYPTSRLYLAWVIANNGLPRSRRPILDHQIFRGKLFRALVTTVRPRHRLTSFDGKVRQGDYLPDYLWYSKVDCLLSLEVTNLPINDNPLSTDFSMSSKHPNCITPFRPAG